MTGPDEAGGQIRPGGSGLPPHLDPRGRRRVPRPAGSGGSRRVPRLHDQAPRIPDQAPRIHDQAAPGTPPVLPGDPVPTPPRPPRRRRLLRVASWVALSMSVVLFAVAALGYVLYQRYDGNISRIPGLTTALPGLAKPAPAPRDARNILLVGSDTRATTGERFQGEGAARTSGQRSDTVILAHLYGDSNQAQLVSFPRDSWVQIPAYTDPATGKAVAAHSAKLNSAIEEGGPALLIATIEKLTDIRVDNYIQIDFAGFQDMVETLGGVEVCLTHDAKESNSGIDLKAGRQTVNGAQALAFVRQRYELPNGDLDRIKRQQAFIASITRKLISAGTLLDPFKLNNFLNAATRSVAVDEDLSTADLTALAFRLRNVSAGGVVFTTVPFTTISARRGGQDVVLLDPVKDAELFDALRSDRPPGAAAPAPSATTAPLTVAPRAIRVSVYNGAGVAGLGRQVAQDLGTAGFVLNGSPGNRGTGATTSVIRYAPSRAEAARTLAAALPSATLEQDAALGSTIELVAGSSYAGLQPVPTVAGAAPSAPAAPPPRPAPAPPVTADADGCVA